MPSLFGRLFLILSSGPPVHILTFVRCAVLCERECVCLVVVASCAATAVDAGALVVLIHMLYACENRHTHQSKHTHTHTLKTGRKTVYKMQSIIMQGKAAKQVQYSHRLTSTILYKECFVDFS